MSLITDVDNQKDVQSSNLEERRSNIYDRLGFDPHVYEISSLAYRDLAITGNDQTILVTGESGAGKTETVKILMDHLASAQFSRPIEDDDQPNNSNDIVARVIKSSPVFEAFGNAKTARNNNSSRFGKFVRLQFRVEPQALKNIGNRDVPPYADLVGSTVSTYLLEKNRVVFHPEGERTFHIFYQLLAAPSDFKQRLWSFFGQASADDFLYTVGSTNTSVDHDRGLWTKTQNALELFKFRNESLIALMQALGIVLQLGNIVFEQDSTSQHENSSFISNRDDLYRLSEMIGINSNDLHETMTSRTLDAPDAESIRVSLTPEAAKEACDALAKEIYSRIFDVIVKRVNEYTLERKKSQGNSLFGQISLLDIFGFEHFEVNRFEQLCINYCNEKLHSKYVVSAI
jgi:myosin heavy subunit